MSSVIYLDNAATTPIKPAVLDAMLPYFRTDFGNAASRNHAYGWRAREAVERATAQLAQLLGCQANELTFTSGATESLNMAIKGIARRYKSKGRHLITTKTEHRAVLDVYHFLRKEGFEISYLAVNEHGMIDLDELADTIREDTLLVTMLWGNNETGVIQPIEKIGQLCHKAQTFLLVDATQMVGKVPFSLSELPIDMLACSAHKFGGPKGIGALYIQSKQPPIQLQPLIHGGGHQEGLRSGTLPVPNIVGMGSAAQLAQEDLSDFQRRTKLFQSEMEKIATTEQAVYIIGSASPRLSTISNIWFRFVDAEALISTMNRRVAVSTSSACSSADIMPSHVLLALGMTARQANACIRFSYGWETKLEDIIEVRDWCTRGLKKLRLESPSYQLFQQGHSLEDY